MHTLISQIMHIVSFSDNLRASPLIRFSIFTGAISVSYTHQYIYTHTHEHEHESKNINAASSPSLMDMSGKRKRGERVFKFKVFGERGYPAEFNGSFEENLGALLEFGQVEDGVNGGAMAGWSFQLEVRRNPLVHVFMFVVEEPIEASLEFSCKHCHYIGWGQNMICNKKYHFLLPSKEYCRSNVIELQRESHSLHGVFHSNGLGHLLCINGSETGSDLAGFVEYGSFKSYQIMEFWDRLCSGLGARKVSLKDVAKKKGMDLRLLHTVAYGKSWFGHWDYTFGRGTYGVNQETYRSAIKAIQNIPLTLIAHQLGLGHCTTQNDVQAVLPKYQVLSGHSLVSLGNLFRFMLELKFRIPKETNVDSRYPGIMSDASCRWSPKRVEMAIHVVVEALKRAEYQWVSRQHVRDVARAYVGDTGLLDFVLKSLGNHMVGKYFVRRCLNPVTKVLEYCLEDVSRVFPKQEVLPVEAKSKNQKRVSRAQVMKDLFYVYKNVMTKNGVLAAIPVASRIILDAKYFVKEYKCETIINDETNNKKIYCRVVLLQNSDKEEAEVGITPYHCFVLRNNATFDELKSDVEKTFRHTYFVLRSFIADMMKNMTPKGSDLVFKNVKPGSKIEFLCRQGCINSGVGEEAMVVDCPCGTKDDDGERMIPCDVCQVWQHTRCVQIPDDGGIPYVFLCSACEQNIFHLRCYATTASI